MGERRGAARAGENVFGAHLHKIRLTEEEREAEGRLRRDVDFLAGIIGERHAGKYEILMAAEKYVRGQLGAATGLEVEEQAYEIWGGRTVRNLIVEQRGVKRPEEIVVVGAHYDTVDGTPGADDNGSAVAGLLEVARMLAGRRLKRTVRYVAFVNEEPPFYKTEDMGSLRYARRCRERNENVVGMINLEMIGYYSDRLGSQKYPGLGKWEKWLPKRGNFVAIASDLASWTFLARVAWGFRWGTRFPMVPFPAPRSVAGPGMSDNWSFWECGYPAVMVTDTSFLRNGHYHTSGDRVETLNYAAMVKVVRGVAGAVRGVAGRG